MQSSREVVHPAYLAVGRCEGVDPLVPECQGAGWRLEGILGCLVLQPGPQVVWLGLLQATGSQVGHVGCLSDDSGGTWVATMPCAVAVASCADVEGSTHLLGATTPSTIFHARQVLKVQCRTVVH